MTLPINRVGQTFGRVTVLAKAPSADYHKRWLCRCECGKQWIVHADALVSGRTSSCGCRRREVLEVIKATHGESRGGKSTTEFSIWRGIKKRCLTPSCNVWEHYGGRGITICDRWKESFDNFLADMGRRPSMKHTIDRIDVNGNYEPGNCRWATWSEQASNKRVKARPDELKTCLECGAGFMLDPRSNKAGKYCNLKCYYAAARRLGRRYFRERQFESA